MYNIHRWQSINAIELRVKNRKKARVQNILLFTFFIITIIYGAFAPVYDFYNSKINLIDKIKLQNDIKKTTSFGVSIF